MRVVDVRSNHGPAFAAFREVPGRVYAGDPVWVAGSEEAMRWAFSESAAGRSAMHAVVAVEDEAAIARAAAFTHDQGRGWIGLFECVAGRPEAGLAVLEASEDSLRRAGCDVVEAPRSDPLTAGLQIGGFDLPQTLFTTHHPSYYFDLFAAAGYLVTTRMVAPIMRRSTAPDFRFELPDVQVRHVDLERMGEELAAFANLQGAVFGGRPGYTERSLDDTRRLLGRIDPYLDPELIVVAEADGAVVGNLICLPDGWQSAEQGDIDRARILSVGVLPGWERRGVGMAMGSHLMQTLLDKQYQSVEGVWVLEFNVAPQKLAARFGAETGRRFAMLQKNL